MNKTFQTETISHNIINTTTNNSSNTNNKPRDLKARRQRNLTTSFVSTSENNHRFDKAKLAEHCLDDFLNSLEEINNYLDKKLQKSQDQLNRTSQLRVKTINSEAKNKLKPLIKDAVPPQTARKSRRFFTQPIIFNIQDYVNRGESNK